jgi:hypothetical protein
MDAEYIDRMAISPAKSWKREKSPKQCQTLFSGAIPVSG